MTVKQLRQLLASLPDDATIGISGYDSVICPDAQVDRSAGTFLGQPPEYDYILFGVE